MLEIGKCYEHKSGKQIYICGKADTVLYGECLIGEEGWNKDKTEQTHPEIVMPRFKRNTGWGLIHIPQGSYTKNNKTTVFKNDLLSDMSDWEIKEGGWYEIPMEIYINSNFEYRWIQKN
jgi:hypothetical protein